MNTELTVIFPTPTFLLVLGVQVTGALLILYVHLTENVRFFQQSQSVIIVILNKNLSAVLTFRNFRQFQNKSKK